jgi:hypothetical protein
MNINLNSNEIIQRIAVYLIQYGREDIDLNKI